MSEPTKVAIVKPQPRLVVTIDADVVLRAEEVAEWQAKETSNWTVINLFFEIFHSAHQALPNWRISDDR